MPVPTTARRFHRRSHTAASIKLHQFEFFASRLDDGGSPAPWTLDDLEDYAADHDDPFAGRVRAGHRPEIVLQLEATSEPPVWIGLERRDLRAWARGISRIWRRYGLSAEQTIAFFDYGSNPFVLLSSSIYLPHLRRGAATGIGANAICNDGVASMTERMRVILEAVSPEAMVVRRDLIAPLCDLLATRGIPVTSRLRWAAISEVEGAAGESDVDRLAAALSVPVRRLFRADAAFFAAGDCGRCGLFHVDGANHHVADLGESGLAVSARFGRNCPAVGYRLDRAVLAPAGCADEPTAQRFGWR